ncbi:MAG TPA: hypothetical protein VFG43_16150, partial [Geminicoccaceae bacterium]|nr:hypothetical protein [Geminicoccaceae bacterium]
MPRDHIDATRRRLLRLGLALPISALAAFRAERAGGQTLAPTPACDDGDAPTPRQTEGPFFTPDSPERRTLREAGIVGTPLLVE